MEISAVRSDRERMSGGMSDMRAKENLQIEIIEIGVNAYNHNEHMPQCARVWPSSDTRVNRLSSVVFATRKYQRPNAYAKCMECVRREFGMPKRMEFLFTRFRATHCKCTSARRVRRRILNLLKSAAISEYIGWWRIVAAMQRSIVHSTHNTVYTRTRTVYSSCQMPNTNYSIADSPIVRIERDVDSDYKHSNRLTHLSSEKCLPSISF